MSSFSKFKPNFEKKDKAFGIHYKFRPNIEKNSYEVSLGIAPFIISQKLLKCICSLWALFSKFRPNFQKNSESSTKFDLIMKNS